MTIITKFVTMSLELSTHNDSYIQLVSTPVCKILVSNHLDRFENTCQGALFNRLGRRHLSIISGA